MRLHESLFWSARDNTTEPNWHTTTGNQTQFGQRIGDEGVFGCAKAFKNEPLLGNLARLTHLIAVDRFPPQTRGENVWYITYWFDGRN